MEEKVKLYRGEDLSQEQILHKNQRTLFMMSTKAQKKIYKK